jgi:hypothetical protein
MSIEQTIEALTKLSVSQLQARFLDAFGEPTRIRHRQWMIKRIAWRLQSQREGTLSERARKRAEELANDADMRLSIPKIHEPQPGITTKSIEIKVEDRDSRLPPPGVILKREYKGRTINVRVLTDGFEWEEKHYPSLSAVAKAVTGSHINGFRFFGLERKETT